MARRDRYSWMSHQIGKLDGHQKRLPAVVVPFPFYDPKKVRVRA